MNSLGAVPKTGLPRTSASRRTWVSSPVTSSCARPPFYENLMRKERSFLQVGVRWLKLPHR